MPKEYPEYRNLAIRKGSSVDRYIQRVYETHNCKSREEAIAIIIGTLDPDWDFLEHPEKETTGEMMDRLASEYPDRVRQFEAPDAHLEEVAEGVVLEEE